MEFQFTEEDSRIVAMDAQDKEAGEVTYSKTGKSILTIDHTEVANEHRGQGLAAELVRQVVAKAKNEDLKVNPVCPFAKKEFDEKEEYREVQHN